MYRCIYIVEVEGGRRGQTEGDTIRTISFPRKAGGLEKPNEARLGNGFSRSLQKETRPC